MSKSSLAYCVHPFQRHHRLTGAYDWDRRSDETKRQARSGSWSAAYLVERSWERLRLLERYIPIPAQGVAV